MNVLVVAPHPDDEAIGCGGTVCHHVVRGDRVSVVFLTSGELALKHLPCEEAWRIRESEAEAAAAALGLAGVTFLRCPDWSVGDRVEEAAAGLRPVLEREGPQLVYLPHPGDEHPDHRAALPVTRAALRGFPGRPPVALGYEVWTPLEGYDRVEDISTVMRQKLRAVRCYASQLGYFRYDRAVRGLNQYRGALGGRCDYAEVFQRQDLSLPRPVPVGRPGVVTGTGEA
jgi:N-acetylglucosamine malate deacetylase 1